MRHSIRITLFLCFLYGSEIVAGENYADSLTTNAQRLLLDSVITTFVITECCDTTLGACMTSTPACPIAPRFHNFTAWLILKKEPYDKCMKQLDKRSKSFFDPDTFTIAPNTIPAAGSPRSPVVITAYVSASCPLCKKICIPLHKAVLKGGPLAGKARLSLKATTTGIGDRALMAAHAQGKFWEYFLSLEKEQRRLDKRIVIRKADRLNCDMNRFEKDLTNKKYEGSLSQNRAEAAANGVSITPTFFIGTRRYQSYKDPQWVIDAVEYACDARTTKK